MERSSVSGDELKKLLGCLYRHSSVKLLIIIIIKSYQSADWRRRRASHQIGGAACGLYFIFKL